MAERLGRQAVYAAVDAPEASLPGHWDRLVTRVEDVATAEHRAVLLLDEAHFLPDWAGLLKSTWDRFRRNKAPVHIVAAGSSALHLATGTRESLAGRFERITLTHWSAASIAQVFKLKPEAAADFVVRMGSYPGAFPLHRDVPRWTAYVRDAILEPVIGRDMLALAAVRRPALLRQVFSVAATSPAQVVSLQKIQGQLQDGGALETVAHYLALLEEAFLVAALPKFSARAARRRSAPPKLVTLNNALVAVMDPLGTSHVRSEPKRFGAWLENACLAHAWNSGQHVSYWREEPLEVDGVFEGSWGRWAVEVKSAPFTTDALKGLLELVRRHPGLRPLVICDAAQRATAVRAGVEAVSWQGFLLGGPPGER